MLRRFTLGPQADLPWDNFAWIFKEPLGISADLKHSKGET